MASFDRLAGFNILEPGTICDGEDDVDLGIAVVPDFTLSTLVVSFFSFININISTEIVQLFANKFKKKNDMLDTQRAKSWFVNMLLLINVKIVATNAIVVHPLYIITFDENKLDDIWFLFSPSVDVVEDLVVPESNVIPPKVTLLLEEETPSEPSKKDYRY